jgi:hypothetical protein
MDRSTDSNVLCHGVCTSAVGLSMKRLFTMSLFWLGIIAVTVPRDVFHFNSLAVFAALCTRMRARYTLHACISAGLAIEGTTHPAVWKSRHRASWDTERRRTPGIFASSAFIQVLIFLKGLCPTWPSGENTCVSASPSQNLGNASRSDWPNAPLFKVLSVQQQHR